MSVRFLTLNVSWPLKRTTGEVNIQVKTLTVTLWAEGNNSYHKVTLWSGWALQTPSRTKKSFFFLIYKLQYTSSSWVWRQIDNWCELLEECKHDESGNSVELSVWPNSKSKTLLYQSRRFCTRADYSCVSTIARYVLIYFDSLWHVSIVNSSKWPVKYSLSEDEKKQTLRNTVLADNAMGMSSS